MLSLLHQYLFQFGRVGIPHVGTLEMIYQSPQLDVVEKKMLPPQVSARLLPDDQVPEHQYWFFRSTSDSFQKRELEKFGEDLKAGLRQSPLHWKGLGLLRLSGGDVMLEPQALAFSGLQAVPAEKIIRKDARHAVLVGDREMTSNQVGELRQQGRKKPVYILIAWILLGLSLAAILVWLYLNKFQSSSSGLRTTVASLLP